MTHTGPASLPAPPALGSAGFSGQLVPADLQAAILNLLIAGSPFADSLTRVPTASGSVAFPVASPEGAAWLNELDRFPLINLNDDAVIVALAKIGGIVDVSNESVDDAQINLMGQINTLLRDSLSRDLDLGLLNGSGPPEPEGVIANAPATAGASLYAAAMAARGEIADQGGSATVLAASGTALAAADGSTDSEGHPHFPAGVAAAVGLATVTVPGLDPPLVYDQTRAFLVVRDDFRVEISTDFRFQFDATSLRIKGRFAAAIPDPPKAIRKLDVPENPSVPAGSLPAPVGIQGTRATAEPEPEAQPRPRRRRPATEE